MMNKPEGYLTACRDDQRPTVMDLLPPELAAKLHPVGRLDIDTRGLLLLTDDGMVDQALMLPERHVTKEYFFYAFGKITESQAEMLRTGIEITPGVISRPAEFEAGEYHTVGEVKEYLPIFRRQRYLKNPDGAVFSGILRICEGRKHQVKLMLRAVGCKVFYLKRLSIAGIRLDENLGPGEIRPLNEEEMKILMDRKREVCTNFREFIP